MVITEDSTLSADNRSIRFSRVNNMVKVPPRKLSLHLTRVSLYVSAKSSHVWLVTQVFRLFPAASYNYISERKPLEKRLL